MENPIKIDDLRVPLSLETPIFFQQQETAVAHLDSSALKSHHFSKTNIMETLLQKSSIVLD